MVKPVFLVRQSVVSHYFFQFIGSNGRVILTGESYVHSATALAGTVLARLSAPMNERYERLKSPWQEPYFVLRSFRNQLLATSELYSSESQREETIETAKRELPDAQIEWEKGCSFLP